MTQPTAAQVEEALKYADACSPASRYGTVLRQHIAALESSATASGDALREAVATIEDYLAYEHDGDPWEEDARAMGEMDINDYARDGRLERARAILAKGETK